MPRFASGQAWARPPSSSGSDCVYAAIFNDLGDRLTKSLIAGDFSLYRTVMWLPLRIEPRDGAPYTMTTEDALEKDFEMYHRNIKLHHVNDIFRQVLSVAKLAEDWVEVTSEVNLLRNAERVVAPFVTQHVMRLRGDLWRFSIVRSSIGHINWTLGQARIKGGRFSDV